MNSPLRRVGRLLQGLAVFSWASYTLDIAWSVPKIYLVFIAIFGGACLFIGLMVIQATIAFWTTESLELMNTMTYGGVETAQYPLPIYRSYFRKFFTYIIPLACVNYLPALAILERGDPLGFPIFLQWIAPPDLRYLSRNCPPNMENRCAPLSLHRKLKNE